ncbi:MAG: 30S ribosomal protein S6 [Rhodobacteraceae bacterium]|nr:30S ribosomal protein S6 [Paracoccaceae bacterium]
MPFYEHTMIARQDLSHAQADELSDHFVGILTENGGTFVSKEHWGLQKMAYKIKKNRKGHYIFLKTDSPPEAVKEMERLMRIHEDILRVLTIRVKEHSDKPSPMIQKRDGHSDVRH